MVAHQRIAPAGKLHPDLMAAPGVQADADQTGFSGSQTPIFKPCFLNTAPLAFYHKNLVLSGILPQKILPGAIFWGCAVDHGHIFFDHCPILNGF